MRVYKSYDFQEGKTVYHLIVSPGILRFILEGITIVRAHKYRNSTRLLDAIGKISFALKNENKGD